MNNFENFIKDNIDSLEGLPANVAWSKKSGWDKLNSKQSKSIGVLGLFASAKQATPWYYAVAASLTVAVASYFVMQDFSETETNDQIVAAIAPVLPFVEEMEGSPILERVLSYPHLINMMGESSRDIQNQEFINLEYVDAPQQKKVVEQISPAYLFGGNNLNMIPVKDAFALTTPDHPITKRQWLLDIQGTGGMISSNLAAGMEVELLHKTNNHAFGLGVASNYVLASNRLSESVPYKERKGSGVATFVTASYQKNVSKNKKKPVWVALKTGYLVQNSSTVFSDNTVSVEVSVSANNRVKISPQVYLTDNFSKVVPGIKVGLMLGRFQRNISI